LQQIVLKQLNNAITRCINEMRTRVTPEHVRFIEATASLNNINIQKIPYELIDTIFVGRNYHQVALIAQGYKEFPQFYKTLREKIIADLLKLNEKELSTPTNLHAAIIALGIDTKHPVFPENIVADEAQREKLKSLEENVSVKLLEQLREKQTSQTSLGIEIKLTTMLIPLIEKQETLTTLNNQAHSLKEHSQQIVQKQYETIMNTREKIDDNVKGEKATVQDLKDYLAQLETFRDNITALKGQLGVSNLDIILADKLNSEETDLAVSIQIIKNKIQEQEAKEEDEELKDRGWLNWLWPHDQPEPK